MVKKHSGFSYVEVIIALALFTIVIIAVLPTLLQAGRNLEFAENIYIGHLQAQEMMLVVRDAISDNDDIENAISAHAKERNIELYNVWIRGVHVYDFGPVVASEIDIRIVPAFEDKSIIVVAIWNEDGSLTGRAIGTVHQPLWGGLE